ncbi:M15 family metallopeptidase [Breznakiellaceae bacterium SP9]
MPSINSNAPWLLVNARFGIDKKLEEVIAALDVLGPEYQKYLIPPGGTFNYRPVAGTGRLSAHSFGIAVAPSHYWQWEAKGAAEYTNSIPYRIVEIFEEQGFIWGGKWYHFDTMHFEYRPELLLKARRIEDGL